MFTVFSTDYPKIVEDAEKHSFGGCREVIGVDIVHKTDALAGHVFRLYHIDRDERYRGGYQFVKGLYAICLFGKNVGTDDSLWRARFMNYNEYKQWMLRFFKEA